MPQQKQRSNGNRNRDRTRSQLELQDTIISGADGVPILDHVNLGQGNYRDDDYWQQIRSYRRGLFLHTAWQSTIAKRAVRETKFKLGLEGYNAFYDSVAEDVAQYDPVDLDPLREQDPDEISAGDSRRIQIMERGDEIWERLGEPDQDVSKQQAAALMEKTGVGTDWMPVSWEMVVGRHEASRSRDAELIRDVFGDLNRYETSGDSIDSSKLLNKD